MTGRPIGAVIVGAGLMGRWHADAVRRSGGRIIAVVDNAPQRADTLARTYAARSATCLDDVVGAEDAHIVHVCTPLETHLDLAGAAIAHGHHVIVEKPLAHTATDTAVVLREAARRGVLICPVHQFCFQRGVRKIVNALPALGRPLHVQITACSAGAEGSPSPADRDAVVADILPHPLSLFSAILGGSMAGIGWSIRHPWPGEVMAMAEHDGATLSILISTHGRPTTNSMRLIAERGSAHADLFHGFSVIESGAVSRARKILHPFDLSARTFLHGAGNIVYRTLRAEPAYPGLRELLQAFYSAIRGDGGAPISAESILDIAVARDELLATMRGPAGVSRGA